MTNLSFLETARLWWDRDFHTFPSDNIGLFRYNAQGPGDYYDYILTQLGTTADAYFPFYVPTVSKEWPIEKKREVIVNRLFLDIDVREGDTFEQLWAKPQVFLSKFYSNMDLFFSAGKGFHFYIYITPVTYGEFHDNRETLYWNLSCWLQYLIDKKAFLSLDRVCRVTLTKHSIDPDHPLPMPRWKIPISPTMNLTEILRQSQFPYSFTKEFHNLYLRQPVSLDWRIFLKSPDTLL